MTYVCLSVGLECVTLAAKKNLERKRKIMIAMRLGAITRILKMLLFKIQDRILKSTFFRK